MTESNPIVIDANTWLDYLFRYRSGSEIVGASTWVWEAETLLVAAPYSTSDVFCLIQAAIKAQNRCDGSRMREAAFVPTRKVVWVVVDLIVEFVTA